MLDGIGKGKEIAPGFFEPVTQRNQFLPAIDGDTPTVLEIAGEFLSLDAKSAIRTDSSRGEIDNIGVAPNEWMERLDLRDCRTIFFTPVNFYRAGFAQFDCNNARRRIRAEEHRVLLEIHESSTDCADFHRFKIGRPKSENNLR